MGFLTDIFASILGAKISTDQQNAANDFNATQAEINRNFQSYESALNRSWQSREAEENRDFQSREAEVARIFNSNEAALQRNWSTQEAERARDWQEEMYAKYNSLSGKISQAEQAGVNPMFAITGNAVSPMAASSSAPSGASASGGAASGSSVGGAGLPSGSSASAALVDIVGSMLGMAKLRSEIDLNESTANKNNADAANTDKHTSWIDRINEMDLSVMASEISKNESQVNKDLQDIKESVSRISVNDSTIMLNGAKVSLAGSELDLNATQSVINKLSAKEMELLMPYVQARQEAAIALTNAQTEEAKYSAEKSMYDANISMLKGLLDAKLLDSSYYDDIIKKTEYDAKGSKRSYHWSPVNNICSNLSKILVGLGSAVGGATGFVGTLAKAGSSAATSAPAILSFF